MKNVKQLAASAIKGRILQGGVTTKTLIATAVLAALASTSFTAQAQQTWYFGPFGQQNVSSDVKFGGLTFTASGGSGSSAGLTWKSGTSASGLIDLSGLSLTNKLPTEGATNFLTLGSSANGLNILNLNPTSALTVQGFNITGSYGPITVSGATQTPPTLTNGITVLTLGGTGGITNSGNTNVEFTAVGAALTGATISSGATYTAKGTEKYVVSATRLATVGTSSNVAAFNVAGTGTWSGGFTAEATLDAGTGASTDISRIYAMALGVGTSGQATFTSGDVILNATATQANAFGITNSNQVTIGGSSLQVNVLADAGSATQNTSGGGYVKAMGISGKNFTITSDSISISTTAIGTPSGKGLASFAYGVCNTGGTISIGESGTKTIVISATASVTESTGADGPRDSAYGVLAQSGTTNIGNAGSTTTITADLDKTPPQANWYGNVQGIRVWGETTTAVVNLAGTGTINVPQYEEGYSANINNYAILVSAGGTSQTGGQTTLTVKGDWTANGQVGIGITSVSSVAPSTLAIIEGGSLTVNGDVLVKPVSGNSNTKNLYNLNVTDGALNVEGILSNNDAGTVTVGSADGSTTGTLNATNVDNKGTGNGNGITINEGSTASVTGADPTGGAAFNNTGSLTVNGDLTVDNTLQNYGTSGSIVVGEAGPDGAKGNLTAGKIVNSSSGSGVNLQSGTLTVDDVQNSGTFSTEDGTTLVVTGTVNADDDGNVGGLQGGQAITVGGDLVTNAGNLFADSETNTLTNNTFILSGAEQVTVDGTLTQAQVEALSGQITNGSVAVTDGIVYEAGITGYEKQQFLEKNDVGDLSFTYTQKNTKGPEDKTVLSNLAVGDAPRTASGPIDKAYIDKFFPAVTSQNPQQYDLWSNTKTNTMAVGAINLGSGTQIYVAPNGTLQIGGLNGNLVTSDVGDPTIMVAGNLILGAKEGGNNAAANNLTVNVINGKMTVQGNVVPGAEKLTYGVGTVNLGSVKTTTTPATEGDLLVDNANLNVGTLNATTGSEITVTQGTLGVTNPLQLVGTKTAAAPSVKLNNGSLVSQAGLTASYATITGTGESSLDVGSSALTLTNSTVDMETATISAGTVVLTGTTIAVDEGTIEVSGVANLTEGSSITVGEGSITLGDTTLTESTLTTNNGSITMASATLIDSIINVTDGDLTINGALNASASTAKTSSTITVTNGSLTTGLANIGSGANVTVNVGPTASVSMGATTLAGTLTVNPSADATTLAPVTLASLAFGEESGSFVATGTQLAVQIGVDNMDAVNSAIARAYPGVDFDNVLAIGSTVQFNTADNGFTIGGTQTTGLNLNGSTAVYADLQSLKGNTLFASAEGAEPAVVITTGAQGPQFVLANPVGNRVYTVVDDGFDTTTVDLTENEIKTTNPLYTAYWKNQEQEDPDAAVARDAAVEPNPTSFVVEINEDAVKGELNTIAPNTIIESANTPYGTNIGAETIMNILADIVDTSQYPEKAALINTIALRGAAAHAHEIGISAASMVIDSVWDHTSKLAAAPHEQAKADLWITLDWNHSRANDYKAAGLDNGYKLDLYGATFGADYDFANGLAAGLAVSVGGGEAKSKGYNAGQKTDVTYWGINLYGTYTSPIVNVIGNVGYIGIKNKTKVNGDKGRPDANIWTIGVKAEKDFAINEQITVTPHVGVRYLSVDVDDFNLQGFHYGTDRANLVQFPIGVAFAANLKTANGAAVKPFLDLSFVPTAGDKKVDNTFGITGGSARDVIDTTIASTSMFQGKIGVNASYGAHNFGLNFAIGGGNKGRLDTGLQAKYRFVF